MTTNSFWFGGPVSATGQITAPTASLTGMTINYAVYNNGSGVLASEELLAVSRGGFGAMTGGVTKWSTTVGSVDPGGSGVPVDAVIPGVLSGNTGVFDRVAASIVGVPGSLVMRNSTGATFNPTIVFPSSTNTSLTMINTYNSITALSQCYARTTSNSAQIFTMSAAGYGANASACIRASFALMRSSGGGANTDHGVYEIVVRAVYATGGPGTWTIASPLVYESKDLAAALAASTVAVTSSGDGLRVTVTNNAVSSIDWSGFVQMTYEKQLA
jgi:hypothetical protein